jgi:acyl-CoA thioesterase I
MALTFATLVLMTMLAAGGAAHNVLAAGKPPLKVVALGDSLTSGHRLPKKDAYPALLEHKLKKHGFDATVVNQGLSGDTSAGGVRRLETALAERPDILIVAFGANDGLRGIPVAQVRANLAKIIETAQARGVSVLLVGMEALPLYGWQYTLGFHNMFPDLAAKYRVPLVPFILNGVFGNPDLMSPDGVHPNADGAKVIAANIWTELEALAKSLPVGSE